MVPEINCQHKVHTFQFSTPKAHADEYSYKLKKSGFTSIVSGAQTGSAEQNEKDFVTTFLPQKLRQYSYPKTIANLISVLKDPIPTQLQSGVVYRFKCSNCTI